MKSVDTNILVRVFTKDDPVQTPLAADMMRVEVLVTHGVIMETEWVLRSRYRWTRDSIAAAMRWLLTVETVSIADPEWFAWALDRYLLGADLTDMLHLVASRDLEAFVTFETEMAALAGSDAPVPVEHVSQPR